MGRTISDDSRSVSRLGYAYRCLQKVRKKDSVIELEVKDWLEEVLAIPHHCNHDVHHGYLGCPLGGALPL